MNQIINRYNPLFVNLLTAFDRLAVSRCKVSPSLTIQQNNAFCMILLKGTLLHIVHNTTKTWKISVYMFEQEIPFFFKLIVSPSLNIQKRTNASCLILLNLHTTYCTLYENDLLKYLYTCLNKKYFFFFKIDSPSLNIQKTPQRVSYDTSWGSYYILFAIRKIPVKISLYMCEQEKPFSKLIYRYWFYNGFGNLYFFPNTQPCKEN